jgi:lipoprotein-anchoring transpeptidase ErfK/SrfK
VRAVAALAVAVAALAIAPAARSEAPAISWQVPTPADGATLTVRPGAALRISVAAGLVHVSGVVQITAGPLPRDATLATADGNPGTATLAWTPKAGQAGAYRITFSAQALGASLSLPRTIVVRVLRPQPAYPQRFVLSGAKEIYRWAYVVRPTVARKAPRRSAPVVARVGTLTPEWYPNLVLMLDGIRFSSRQAWVRIRLPILPNNSTGWVPRRALGSFRPIRTRLVIDQGTFRATLYKAGKAIFSTPVGVGQPQWPTPRGEFYIRQKMTGYNNPVYGPWAFGLNARSAVLTDWPGGGFIGIHGTNQPGLIPGRISHGCIRMRNAAITRLARILPLGTPVTVQ